MRFGALCVALLAIAGCSSLEGARLYRSGTAALDVGRPDRAVEDLERAAVLVPHASEIQNHLGLAYEELGRPEAARRAFERAVELDCDNEAAQENLAHAAGIDARDGPTRHREQAADGR